MPSASTTLTALEAAFAEAIRGIVPTIAIERAAGWVHGPDRRPIAPSMTPRRYTIEWAPQAAVIGGATGNADAEYELVMRVVTDYRGFRKETLADVVAADGLDVHDRLADRLDDSGPAAIPGLMWVSQATPSYAVDNEDAQVIAHLFNIQYLRARPSTV
jgi:hypothetical protein